MRVLMKSRWRALREGTEHDLPDGMANLLIQRGIAEEKAEGGRRKADRRRIRRSKPFVGTAEEAEQQIKAMAAE